MSGSEDGQLKSPPMISAGEENDEDSLYIKPPQANLSHPRDSSGLKRKTKFFSEKNYSKDKKDPRSSSGNEKARERETRDSGDMERERRSYKREEPRYDLDRYNRRGSFDRNDCRDIIPNADRRYHQKHFEQRSGGEHNYYHQQHQYHHHTAHSSHLQINQRHRQDYYERNHNYHHSSGSEGGGNRGGVGAAEYQTHRYTTYGKISSQNVNYVDIERERRKYNYEHQKDAESLEQDLRSRLLSKRHKYVKSTESIVDEQYEELYEERRQHERIIYEEARKKNVVRDSERREKVRREKLKEHVIEVLDSPEKELQKRKHKRRKNEKVEEVASMKRKTPDDPELLARRDKILAAEREKEKRKESAREELEARRRERTEAVDMLSPTAVAASVTAGLKIIKRKQIEEIKILKKKKRVKQYSDQDEDREDDDDDDDDDGDDDDSESQEHEEDSDSPTDSDSEIVSDEKNYKKVKSSKRIRKLNKEYDSDVEVELELPDSPLSIGDLKKSPKHIKKTKQQNEQLSTESRSASLSNRDHSTSRSRSRSRQSRSISRSSSHLSDSGSDTSRAGSRSRSNSPRSQNRFRSRSRSGTRSEERDMKMHLSTDTTAKKRADGEESPVKDDKGLLLPNYFPGIQGCRSVEEFQCLNRIEEGTYGVVYRAKDKRTNEIVALKRLKMEKEKEGFPITSLREINTLLKGQHPNIVTVREIVVGSNMDKIFIVMDYVEHDLKSLMETMKARKQSFLPGEVKCLVQQLLCAVGHLHDNWILHRDLKTSNLLLSHKGILKVGDFGLAREYGSPLKKYTSLVVTLWYRAPELLLCCTEYSTAIDIWSVGCIFGEFLQMAPLFPGKSEVDQLNRIFKELGTPNETIWPGYKELPAVKNLLSQNSQFADYPVSNIRKRFGDKTSELGISLLRGLLTFDPKQRLTADGASKHSYFKELPLPIDPSMFPTWPAKSELGARKALASSPKPPSGGSQFKQLGRDEIVAPHKTSGIITGNKKPVSNTGFVLNAGIDQRQLAMGPGFNLKF